MPSLVFTLSAGVVLITGLALLGDHPCLFI